MPKLLKKLQFLFILILIASCASGTNKQAFMSVSLGMTKKEVIELLGVPNSVSAIGNTEYLTYTVIPSGRLAPFPGEKWDHFVRLVSGKVEAYGKVGDFDSTKNSAQDINLNINDKRK